MRDVVVVYEDQGAPRKEFGLHKLVVRSVYERLVKPPPYFRIANAIVGVPRRGNGNVLKDVKNAEVFTSAGEAMVAVFDRDQAQLLLKTRAACFTSLRAAIHQQSPIPLPVFLDRNIETLIAAIRDAGHLSLPPSVFTDALNKSLDARDRVFIATAGEDAHLQGLRQTVLTQVPSFGYLVTKLVGLVGP